MNLKVTIKDVGEKEVQADQVITPAGSGLVLFQVNGPAAVVTPLWVALTELICVEVMPDPPPAPAAPPQEAPPSGETPPPQEAPPSGETPPPQDQSQR